MKSIITDSRIPIKVWEDVDKIEKQALTQLRNAANLPGSFHHIAAMPDVHTGYGSTIGSVFASAGCVCPSAVGVDIGCGMMAFKTSLRDENINRPRLRSNIESTVPVGFSSRQRPLHHKVLDNFKFMHHKVQDLELKVRHQLGTLGGGNHFIEICLDEDGAVWVMLHSGSRGIGKTLADIHINEAKGLMKKYYIDLPDPHLAYLVDGTAEFQAYIRDLEWAQDYAMANREMMMSEVLSCLISEGWDGQESMRVNCHHNYVSREHHFGHNVLVTRKGAVRARVGDLGIIPGSMGAKSYIVEGLGNPESFMSCSHGAGRRMSRTKARATFTTEDLARQTEGVECRKDEAVIDEIPGAYKDIDVVMENQSDLVKIVATLKQIICIKG